MLSFTQVSARTLVLFFPFVMLSIFLLNFLIFSAIARPTQSCDDASNWYPRCQMQFWIKLNAIFGNVTSLRFQSSSPFTCKINEMFSPTKGAMMWIRSGLIGGSLGSEGSSQSHPLLLVLFIVLIKHIHMQVVLIKSSDSLIYFKVRGTS